LKTLIQHIRSGAPLVAPRVGAWIEKDALNLFTHYGLVAPRVGAWIEKNPMDMLHLIKNVAPRVGAWIENHFVGIVRHIYHGSLLA
jgi:dihydroneopterin aldolase